jgi:hypothetical protein
MTNDLEHFSEEAHYSVKGQMRLETRFAPAILSLFILEQKEFAL